MTWLAVILDAICCESGPACANTARIACGSPGALDQAASAWADRNVKRLSPVAAVAQKLRRRS
jgi:hypothetical protein